jgi:hypothetical protein
LQICLLFVRHLYSDKILNGDCFENVKSVPHLFKYYYEHICLAYREKFSDLELSKINLSLKRRILAMMRSSLVADEI